MTTLEDRPDIDLDELALAAEVVVSAGYGSQRLVQRKLRVGWEQAATLLAALEAGGIVGAPDDEGTWPVLVGADEAGVILAGLAEPEPVELADEAGEDLADEPGVDLVKHQPHPGDEDDDGPGDELAIRPDDDLAIYQPRQVELYTATPRQQVARLWCRLVDEPAITRSVAVTRQAPKAGARLVIWTPRGAVRGLAMSREWLFATRSQHMVGRLADQDHPEWHKSAAELGKLQERLATRRWMVGVAVGVAALVGLAWWAPQVFAGLLAVVVAVAVVAVARPVCREPKELAMAAGVALALGWVTWRFGPDLAALIPRPPVWVWWVLVVLAVVGFGWLGRKEDQKLVEMPATMAAHEPPPITAPMIVEALFRIGVAGMTTIAADKGMRDEIRVIAPGVAASKHGYITELELPPGVTAEMVVAKRGPLAGALRRDLGCVWPSGNEDRHPGYLRLFISRKAMNKAEQPMWPLAAGTPIDIFEPMPLFTDEEMRWVSLTLAGTPHLAVGGASGFGKSVWLRQLSCGVAFDLRVRIVVIDGKRSGDLDHVRKLAHAFHEGADPEDVEAVVVALRGLVNEYLKRSKFLSALPPEERSPKVTSALANKYPAQLSPIVVFYDEVQEGTQYGVKTNKEDKAIRDEITGQLTRLSRVGRSAGIYLVLASQRPEADVIPSSIMGNCSIRVAFKVSDQTHNDQILGTSARKNGIDATMFGTRDKGMAWLKGGDDVDAQVVRSWSAMVDVGVAVELADKAYELRKAAGLLTGQALDDGVQDAEIVYDVVADAEAVMTQRGYGKAQWGELVVWLGEFREQWAALSEEELSAGVRAAGVRVADVRSGNSVRKGVYITDLRKRGSDDLDD